MSPDTVTAAHISIRGIVQGVGFRPHARSTADRCGISGWVRNGKGGVMIRAEGSADQLHKFLGDVREAAPRMAFITDIDVTEEVPAGYDDFSICASDGDGKRKMLISPDVSTCHDCEREIRDSSDRRFGYPFTNCTNCGPRFTIIRHLPYDRSRTSMSGFPLCAECEREYCDPEDRRFHAQPTACPSCGPHVRLLDGSARVLAEEGAIRTARQLLCDGDTVAVQGIGGFHLACRADDPGAVLRLRGVKNRPSKPLAVMVRDLAAVGEICRLKGADVRMLQSPAAPIVILPRREGAPIAGNVAPECASVGVMLPYTPLHMLLFSGDASALVMTSGNRRGLPLAKDAESALTQLGDSIGAFLIHDRPIVRRCDDSVVRSICVAGDDDFIVYRRSRGYAPRPVLLNRETAGRDTEAVLGCGGDEKNTFCLLDGDEGFFSQHIGSLRREEVVEAWRDSVDDLIDILEITPGAVAHDLHPDYRSSHLAAEYAKQRELTRISVQHHHAHCAACLAENGRPGPALGVIADGTGYGDDGTLWGMEILLADLCGYRRLVSLEPVQMPGGERAVRRPLRMTLAHLRAALGSEAIEELVERFPAEEEDLCAALIQMERDLNAPMTSSCGRLFDAAAAVLDICLRADYSGQPAVQLSERARRTNETLPFALRGGNHLHRWDLTETWEEFLNRLRSGDDPTDLASIFQSTVAEMMVQGVRLSREISGCDVVALSGGVFQNCSLLSHVRAALSEEGFSVLVHDEVPPNDGGISLGQAVVGRHRIGCEGEADVSGCAG